MCVPFQLLAVLSLTHRERAKKKTGIRLCSGDSNTGQGIANHQMSTGERIVGSIRSGGGYISSMCKRNHRAPLAIAIHTATDELSNHNGNTTNLHTHFLRHHLHSKRIHSMCMCVCMIHANGDTIKWNRNAIDGAMWREGERTKTDANSTFTH